MKQIQPIALTNDEALELRAKKLVTIKSVYGDLWVRASKRGRQLVRYMWPEIVPAY